MLSLRTPNEEITGFFKVKEPGEHLSSYWIGSCFYIQKEEIRFWQRGCWLTLVRGRSTKVDCSPLFPNISSKTTCFEMMTLETLQNSCDKLCWDTWPSVILTLFLPRLIHREVTLIHSSNCFSLYPRVYQLSLCHYVTWPWSERHVPFISWTYLYTECLSEGEAQDSAHELHFIFFWESGKLSSLLLNIPAGTPNTISRTRRWHQQGLLEHCPSPLKQGRVEGQSLSKFCFWSVLQDTRAD